MISYEPFFETLKKKGITSYRLGKMGFPMTNYHSLRRGNSVSTQTIDALCRILDCNVSDIMTYVKDEDKD